MGASDWMNPKARISPNFTVGEALLLPKWGVHHIPNPAQTANIVRTTALLERIRAFLGGKAITVTSWIRPGVANVPGHSKHGQDYNALIGGAKSSAHREGLAVDFRVAGMTCDEVRAALKPKLEEWNFRMENLPESSWVHVDLFSPRPNRFFRP